MALVGAARMSDVELVAIILGTGSRGESSLRLAERLVTRYEKVGRLGAAEIEELAEIEGMGPAKAAQVLAAVELGKRAGHELVTGKPMLDSPDKVAGFLMPTMRYLETEHFTALIVNNKNQLIKSVDIAIGSLSAAIIHPRELYKAAIRANGAGLIAAHNHPSGDTTPSREDIVLTRRLAEAGRIIGIELIDHVIIGDGRWLSLKEKGFLAPQGVT